MKEIDDDLIILIVLILLMFLGGRFDDNVQTKTFPVLEAEPMGAISDDKSLQPGVIGRTGGAIPPTGANQQNNN